MVFLGGKKLPPGAGYLATDSMAVNPRSPPMGLPGAVIATLGNVLPCCIIAITLSYCYKKLRDNGVFKGVLQGLRPAVVALIASAGLTIALLALMGTDGASFDWAAAALFAAALFVLRRFKLNPILVMVGCGIVGMIVYLIL